MKIALDHLMRLLSMSRLGVTCKLEERDGSVARNTACTFWHFIYCKLYMNTKWKVVQDKNCVETVVLYSGILNDQD